ncbi:hypothetical protein [Chelativorans intermedius]|uniref:Transmembrane protein (PGPGW) n=1 Tax=Chelativorans intermedius TaxID=515947 RepID=A0ABV6D5C4_9HYPH
MQETDTSTRHGDSRRGHKGPRPHVSLAGRRMPLPRSRIARMVSGGLLVVLGLFGFLPVLGFWMIPAGLLILSYDMATVRRLRRRLEVWWHRRREKRR